MSSKQEEQQTNNISEGRDSNVDSAEAAELEHCKKKGFFLMSNNKDTVTTTTTKAEDGVEPGVMPPAERRVACVYATCKNPYKKEEKKQHCTTEEILCPICPYKIKGVIHLMIPKSVEQDARQDPKYTILKRDEYGYDLKAQCPACNCYLIVVWRLLPIMGTSAALSHQVTPSMEGTGRGLSARLNCPICHRAVRCLLEMTPLPATTKPRRPSSSKPALLQKHFWQFSTRKKRKRSAIGGDVPRQTDPSYFVTHNDKYGDNTVRPCPMCCAKIVFCWRTIPVKVKGMPQRRDLEATTAMVPATDTATATAPTAPKDPVTAPAGAAPTGSAPSAEFWLPEY